MAETNALLKRHTGNRIEGSNPSVSAKRRSFGRSGAFKSAEIPALPSKLPITSATWTHLFGAATQFGHFCTCTLLPLGLRPWSCERTAAVGLFSVRIPARAGA